MEFALDGGVRLNVSSPLRGAAKDGVFQARRASGDDKISFREKNAVKSKGPSKSQPPALQEVKTCLARAALATGGWVSKTSRSDKSQDDFGLVNLTHPPGGLCRPDDGAVWIWSIGRRSARGPGAFKSGQNSASLRIAPLPGNSLASTILFGLLFFGGLALRFAIAGLRCSRKEIRIGFAGFLERR